MKVSVMLAAVVVAVPVQSILTLPAVGQSPSERIAALEARLTAIEGQLEGPRVIELYERYRRGVVQVQSGLSKGSGFFVNAPERLIVTNDHVVQPGQRLSVLFDSIRVPAQVVVQDHDADLALLRIHPELCPDCTVLPLAFGPGLVSPGERVVALGSPLHQPSAVTSGIVSAVRGRGIISDVSLNGSVPNFV
jgi:S1-C subfamily serine protease